MSKMEYNPISGELDKVGDGTKVYGVTWDDGEESGETYEEMMERRVSAIEAALTELQQKTANL